VNHPEVRCLARLLRELQRLPGTVISDFRFRCASFFIHVYELVSVYDLAIA
jgi:hypothetical protein